MTLSEVQQLLRKFLCFVLVAIFGVNPDLAAQTHIVSPSELQNEIAARAEARQQHREVINGLLSSPKVEKALRTVRIDTKDIKAAVSSLSDEELARLAARSAKIQADLAGGRLTDRDLLIILIGIAALILIIVAVD